MDWQWLAMLGAGAVAALLFRRHVGFLTRVRGHSMWPTLRSGQMVFTRPVLHGRRLRRGDIAVVQSAELGQRVVKRVLGLPDDELAFGSGGLVRNGEPVAEPYAVHAAGMRGLWRVPAGHCFLLGDNRAASSDSRSWEQPFAPLETIVGRVCTRCAQRAGSARRRRSAPAAASSRRRPIIRLKRSGNPSAVRGEPSAHRRLRSRSL
jgi:signal peptidase I